MASDVDAVVSAETPEGILLELRPAGLTARFLAFAVDWLIRLVVIYGAAIVGQFLAGFGIAFYIVLIFALDWFYPVYFEIGRSGATPGKKIMGLKVVMDNGLPTTPAASFTRNLLRVADLLLLYGPAIVCMLVRADCKRLGDMAAATLVVHEPKPAPKLKLERVEPLAPRLALAPRDQAAVIALAARAPTLTVERLDELAALAAAVSGDAGRSGRAVTHRVLGVAQWLMGRRG